MRKAAASALIFASVLTSGCAATSSWVYQGGMIPPPIKIEPKAPQCAPWQDLEVIREGGVRVVIQYNNITPWWQREQQQYHRYISYQCVPSVNRPR